MDDTRDRITKNRYGIYGMWLHWTMSAGALIAALLLALVVPKVHYPFVPLSLCLVLYLLVRYNRGSREPVCAILPFITAKALLWSSIIMFVINIMHRKGVIDLILVDEIKLINPEIPYIAGLILFPMMILSTCFALARGPKLGFCVECIRQNGTGPERGFLGQFYSREGRYQLRLMLGLNIFCAVVAWGYYFLYYINVNMNAPDRFFFDIAPALLFAFSIVYVTARYIGVWQYYNQNFDNIIDAPGRTTKVRFMIISGDEMLLNVPDPEADLDYTDLYIDTPVTLTLRRKLDVTVKEATTYFTNMTNISDVPVKFLYSNTIESNDFSIYYFLVTLPSTQIPEEARLKGDWFSFKEVIEMLNAQSLDPLLSTEILRLYNMTMAWKTYDANGRRRYSVKGYKPHFKLSDLTTADIDYNDFRWLYIAANNEDKPFFRLRRFWSKYVSGALKS